MHTDATLDILSPVTTSLGNSLRTFEEKTCTAYDTRELERERAARQRRQEKSATNAASESRRPVAPNTSARKQKKLNLRTYKHHVLGDYVDTIRRFGTTDSYSTQPVRFYLMICMPCLTVVVGIRASLSTEHPKLGHFRLAADRYHSKYQGLSDENTVSAQSARGCIAHNLAHLPK
jgi:hypothetical protein